MRKAILAFMCFIIMGGLVEAQVFTTISIDNVDMLELYGTLDLGDDFITDIEFDHESAYMAVAVNSLSWPPSGFVSIYDVNNLREIARLEKDTQSPWRLLFSPDDEQLAIIFSSEQGGELIIWNYEADTKTTVINFESPYAGLIRMLYWGDDRISTAIPIYDPNYGAVSVAFAHYNLHTNQNSGGAMVERGADAFTNANFSPDGSLAAFAGFLVDVETGDLLAEFDDISQFNDIVFNSSGETFTYIANDYVKMWDISAIYQGDTTQYNLAPTQSGNLTANYLAISPDFNLMAIGHFDGRISFWDISSISESELGTVVAAIENTSQLTDMEFNPNGSILATSGDDGVLRLWGIASAE